MGAQAAWGFRGSRGCWLNCWAQETKGLGDDRGGRAESWTPAPDRVCWARAPAQSQSEKEKLPKWDAQLLGLNLSPAGPWWRCEHRGQLLDGGQEKEGRWESS